MHGSEPLSTGASGLNHSLGKTLAGPHLDKLSPRHPGRVWMTYHSTHVAPGCGIIMPILIHSVVPPVLLHHSSHLIEERCHEAPLRIQLK